MEMAALKDTKLTFTGNHMDDDRQQVDVFRIYSTQMITFYACHMPEFGLEGKVMRCPWNKPMFVPSLAFSGKLGGMHN